ncbi:Rad52/Rad22 family DNA repair protein [Pseudoalteromonas obscura]|uniref:Rad52/Rad22 family DNA repair protein n=1 Tax=Pseudoalteromonas obscura TaxID=3048491 RepID=A0ABT7EHC2_9GAMM|nr:Rad52/Rad22 family DNA repair protein [Pseudoalteromonas sp. P94(2023)]MDK2594422.1 Rad52/Rad22 family DNA repair protein [Pseudoalteromonas sp. P94(2023)]
MTAQQIKEKLSAPFHDHEVEWMVNRKGMNQDALWVEVVPFITNRAVQHRLDEVLGIDGWKNEFKDGHGGQICGLSIKVGDSWVTKWDGASYTDFEPLKGALSSSMKRASVQFGIGRYLHLVKPVFIECQRISDRNECTENYVTFKHAESDNQYTILSAQWPSPLLPAWALPVKDISPFIESINAAKTETELKKAFSTAIRCAEAQSSDVFRHEIKATKEQRMSEIKQAKQQSQKESFDRFEKWFAKKLEQLKKEPNEAVLDMTYTQLLQELKGQCMSLGVEMSEYQNQLQAEKAATIAKIQGA